MVKTKKSQQRYIWGSKLLSGALPVCILSGPSPAEMGQMVVSPGEQAGESGSLSHHTHQSFF